MTQETTAVPYLKAKILAEGKITCLTGLHIGGADTAVDVGGIDKFVVRNPLNDQPYLPGSSIKGKIRSLIEYARDKDKVLAAARNSGVEAMPDIEEVKNLFGVAIRTGRSAAGDELDQGKASKVLFRDAILSQESAGLESRFSGGLKYTERKAENTLARITGKANPRQIERIPAGTIFDFGLVVNVDEDNYQHIAHYLGLLKLGFDLLCLDGLGGMVSRGYGRIEIKWTTMTIYKVPTDGGTDLEVTTLDDSQGQQVDFDRLITAVSGMNF